MKSSAYYNEIDPLKAEVLRVAIAAGAIAPGDVDERSIADIDPAELVRYTQCHFFAGGGFWSLALRWAGWPDDRPVWTGSCPCPSFSAAGKGKGFADPRHLWPHWIRLIAECRPAVVFGEQVAAAIGHGWLDLVQDDLEAADYAVGSAVLGACSVGAPHIRQRLYFCADTENAKRWPQFEVDRDAYRRDGPGRGGDFGLRADTDGRESGDRGIQRSGELGLLPQDCGTGNGALADRARPLPGRDAGEALGYRSAADADGGAGGSSIPLHPERRPLDVDGSNGCDRQDSGREETHGIARTRGEVLGGSNTTDPRRPAEGQHGSGPPPPCTRSEQRSGPGDGGDADMPSTTRFGQDGRESETSTGIRGEPSDSGQLLRDWRGPGWLDPLTARHVAEAGATRGFWADCDWWYGRDGKFRPAGPGIQPLAHGSPARVGRLRMYGDGICVPLAQTFIESYLESRSATLDAKTSPPDVPNQLSISTT